ncbi:MAG: DUF4384 domain-containing protein [Bacteroidetes bacterium]|nr:MAG: DUF4384 domain-containing protein [Bacteroidota bacterium]
MKTSCIPARWQRALLSVLFLFVLVGLSALHAQDNRKFAFLVAIGDYPQEGGWQKINATNDLTVIRAALEKRGFPPQNIITVTDEAATQQGILDAWEKRFLPLIKAGDVVYFQFSGHGQQVADDGNDEPDGYDEAIVPYDSPQRFEPGVYEGENLIRDDQLNDLFYKLRSRLGQAGNLMVVLDACHSGTGTRGMTPARGTDRPMASDDYIKENLRKKPEGPANRQFKYEEEDGATRLAPMAAFFGSAHNQLNFEARDEQGQLLGSLSYALSKKLDSATPATSYRGLFEQVRIEMSAIAPRQQPQAEGMLDQEIMGGRLLEKPAYFVVESANSDTQVVLEAGSVQGLNSGAIVALYRAETRDTGQVAPWSRGEVKKVLPFKSIVELQQPIPMDSVKSAWVYVEQHNFGDLKLGFSIRLSETDKVREALKKELEKNPVFSLDEAPEVFLIDSGGNYELIGQGDIQIEKFDKNMRPDILASRVIDHLKGYCRTKYIRQMEASSPYLNVDFELVPVKTETMFNGTVKEAGVIPVEQKTDAQGMLHFQENDAFRFRITNNGKKPAYFTIVDLQPDNVSRSLIPAQESTVEKAADFRLAPGETMDSDLFRIGPPAGTEMFKLIATTEPIDLRPIMNSRGQGTKNASQSPFEKLFQQTYLNEDVQTRGGKTVNLATGTLNIYSYTFIID